MTAIPVSPSKPVKLQTPEEVRRARVLGFVYIGLAALVLFAFTFSIAGGDVASFGLSRPTDAVEVSPLQVPARAFTIVVAVLFGFLGAVQLTRGFGNTANLVLGGALIVFVFAFLTWAAAGGSFSLVGMLQATLTQAAPIALGGMAGILSERVAVINIAIEGQLLTGAFVAVIVGSVTNQWIGLLAAIISGVVLGWVLAVLAIKYLVDQIIIGVFINIFALGLTSFLASRLLSENPDLNSLSLIHISEPTRPY